MIHILSNTVGRQSSKVLVSDASNVERTDEVTRLRNIVGGGRHLFYAQTGSATRRIVYLDEGQSFEFDFLYIRHASLNTGNTINVIEWSDYPSNSNTLLSSIDLDDYLVGRKQLDAIIPVENSGTIEAVGIEIGNGYNSKVGQIYFSKTVTFDGIQPGASYTRQVLNERQAQYKHYDNYFDIVSFYDLRFEVTKSQYDEFCKIEFKEPLVIYDDEQALLAETAVHCLIRDYSANPVAEDSFYLSLSLAELRQWE